MKELENAVNKVLEEGIVSIKPSSVWDGDCYVYSVKAGETILCRTYDAEEACEIRLAAEDGRKALFSDPSRIKDIKDLAYAQWSLTEDEPFSFLQTERAVSFEFNDMDITNPWIDESARFPLNDRQAVSTYGEINVGKFILEASDRMAAFPIIQKQLHDPGFRKKAGLEEKPKQSKHRAR